MWPCLLRTRVLLTFPFRNTFGILITGNGFAYIVSVRFYVGYFVCRPDCANLSLWTNGGKLASLQAASNSWPTHTARCWPSIPYSALSLTSPCSRPHNDILFNIAVRDIKATWLQLETLCLPYVLLTSESLQFWTPLSLFDLHCPIFVLLTKW